VEHPRFEVRWTRRAQIDLGKIIDEISNEAPRRAIAFGRKIQDASESLQWSPLRCPRIKEDLTCRHIIVKKYRVVFEIDEENRIVWINAILFPYQQYVNR